MWRLIVGRYASLREIDEHYSYLDLMLANEALDLQDEAEFLNRRAEETRQRAQQGR